MKNIRFFPITIFFIIALSDCNCGNENFQEMCGLKVDPGKFDIQEELVCQTIDFTEYRVNERRPLSTYLSEALKNEGVEVKYLSSARPKTDEDEEIRGRYWSNKLIEIWPIGEPFQLCMEIYYVLGHELLHFVVREVLKESDEDGLGHDIPDIFIKEPNIEESAEFDIWMDAMRICVDFNPEFILIQKE